MITKAKAEIKNNPEEEIKIKMQTTKQILKDLDSCYGITKRSKEVIKMYADYIKLYKKKKIKIGNLNMILNCNNSNYSNIVNVINNILFKEGIIQYTKYELLTDVHIAKNYNINTNALYVINDDGLKDYKLEKLVADNPTSVFIVICNENNSKMVDKIRSKFTWEIIVKEPSEEEKIQYIKNTILEHELTPQVTRAELQAITCYDMETIESFLISAILKANKKKLTYISKEELNIMKNPNHKLGMKKLNNLIGLADVKEQVQQILNYVKVHKQRGSLPTLNMCFKGNPGTGKTEVARTIAEIFADNEILDGNFVEVGRNDLVAGYVGQTAMKTQKVIESALGGVLFIDEAYSLFSDDSYSKECISTLIKAMEDHRQDLCVILAGYPQKMDELLKSNSGFESRIAFKIDFPDYTADELYQIFIKLIKQEGFDLDKTCKQIVMDYFANEIKNADDSFGNGRLVRNLLEKIKMEQATRLINTKTKELDVITADDVTNVVDKIKTTATKKLIGFAV